MGDPTGTAARGGRIRRRLAVAAADVVGRHRPLLAVKTALAGVLAWYLAPLIPFAEDQYSYYAPLGALVTMYPTLARSTKSGFQAVLGLALGILIGLGGLALVRWGLMAGAALAIVLVVGVLIGGIRALGLGREWVTLAGLFVLLLGGDDAEGFSVSYLVTMGFGVIVGILVNLVILPPLYVRAAGRRLGVLRESITVFLRRTADDIAGDRLDPRTLLDDLAEIEVVEAEVGEEVQEADESRRGNPRGRRGSARDLSDENSRRLAAMERTGFLLRDLVDVLERMTQGGGPWSSTRDALATAVARTADLVATPVGAEEGPARLEEVDAALREYRRVVDAELGMPPTEVAESVSVILCLQRIVDVSRSFV